MVRGAPSSVDVVSAGFSRSCGEENARVRVLGQEGRGRSSGVPRVEESQAQDGVEGGGCLSMRREEREKFEKIRIPVSIDFPPYQQSRDQIPALALFQLLLLVDSGDPRCRRKGPGELSSCLLTCVEKKKRKRPAM